MLKDYESSTILDKFTDFIYSAFKVLYIPSYFGKPAHETGTDLFISLVEQPKDPINIRVR